MKTIIGFTFASVLFLSCNTTGPQTHTLEEKVKNLQTQLGNVYKPGLGEFMSGIQVHHSKLWFAGINSNWKLADFEVGEIKEALDAIQKFNTDRKEVQSIPMLFPAIDSINAAIQKKSMVQFKSSFTLLTNTCNNCHKANNFEFNVIKIPESPPFSNQDFKLDSQK